MCEPEEDGNSNGFIHQQRSKELPMDLDDLDLDNSWPLDQIPFIPSSNHMMSPFVISSSSERPCSPLWAFSDGGGIAAAPAAAGDDEKLSSSSGIPPLLLAECPLFFPCTSSSVGENSAENNNNVQIPASFMGLVPQENTDNYCVIKERMTQALRTFKETSGQHVLAQVWAPVKKGNRYMLTTLGQPFVLDPSSNGLNQYRMISLTYMFSLDGESDIDLGLPGRVFRQKLPEWTPNVQYYSIREFSRLNHALNYNVRGTLALPVFNPSGQSCIGVLELIMTSEKIHYAPDVDKVCKALEAVNLKSSEILDHQTTQICNESRQNALAEILEILTLVCETHKLPLAQTWVPCQHGSVLANGGGLKKICASFDGSCMGQVCMSTTDIACYVVDAHVWGFRDACLEHHLQKGQGVAGRAFLNRSSCFCRDVTQFCKTQYPLVHYARMFNLNSCFAICLQSSHTGDDDYILEFFLPSDITDNTKQDSLLGSLLATMKQHFQSLRIASGIKLGENEASVEIIEASPDKQIDSRFESIQIPISVKSQPVPSSKPEMLLSLPNQQLVSPSDTVNNKSNNGGINGREIPVSMAEVKETKKPERKRGKAEKTISLDVLQQYFTGSLKDAAKSLGVCPTTMKRICRQHGISRWPSRKINKVNRSLTKLKCVIESVQGTDGALDLTSLASTPLPVGSIQWPPNQTEMQPLNSPSGPKPPEPPKKDGSSPPAAVNECSVHERDYVPDLLGNGCKRSRTGSVSREESVGTPTSHGSCEGSPQNETKALNHEQLVGCSSDLPFQPSSIELNGHFRGMLVEDAGSYKDLRKLCPSIAGEKFPESSWAYFIANNNNKDSNASIPPKEEAMVTTTPTVPAGSEMRMVTVKASYKEDIIRFRISSASGIMELKEEVAKRLKLEVGTFDIKYLDDDHERVLIACDADLQECFDIVSFSGSSIVRLSVHDVMANLGSSCESTGEL